MELVENRTYRWFPILRWIGVLISIAALVTVIGLLTGKILIATTRTMDFVAAGIFILVVFGGLVIYSESFEINNEGLVWQVIGWKMPLKWSQIERLVSQKYMFIIRTTSIITNRQNPMSGNPIFTMGFIQGLNELEATVISRANLVRIPESSSWLQNTYDRIATLEPASKTKHAGVLADSAARTA